MSETKSPCKGKYEVVSVKRSSAPTGMSGSNWHCYIIRNGKSSITGMKAGTLRQVTEHAKRMASDLNARSGANAGSFYTSRSIR